MSGRSLEDAISFSDDEEEAAIYSEDEVEFQRYDSDEDTDDDDEPLEDESDDDEISAFDNAPPIFAPPPETFELPSLSLDCGDIRPGHVVELEDHTERTSKHLISGDFLLVRSIIEDVHTEEVVIRGYRMRRVEYLPPLFDRKLNDLVMLIEVQEGDERPRFVQGLEDVSPEEVTRIRRCIFTHLDYNLLGQSHVNRRVPLRLETKSETREWVFSHGKLICRWVYVMEQHPKIKSCGGEVRRMYKREVADFSQRVFDSSTSSSTATPTQSIIPIERARSSPVASPTQSHRRTGSIQEVPQRVPQKSRIYTYGDGYCGCGGASEGAQQAGYKVLWGLEKDPTAMEAYRKNFPGAMHLEMDAHDFPDVAKRCIHGCDHLHMSCPCCFWSEAHTNEGKNDEANIMTLFTVEAWLNKLKSRTFSLEQAPGLLKLEKHRMFFRILLNGILSRGYNVRWKIQDQAWFGIAQHRRRLIFVGAKIGTPLPPFPSPIHGPPGSGLKRFVTIEDALRPLQQAHSFRRRDPYHQPDLEKQLNEKAFDPHTNLAKCITTSGGDNVHYSGKRSNTCRELSQFQGFKPTFHFTGSVTEAKKQCGNAWPVKSNTVYFLTWAAHMEAFDHGFIDTEDEVLDLYDFLEKKGITIPKPAPIDIDLFNTPAPVARPGVVEPEYRYLPRIDKTVRPRFPLQLWGRRKEIDPLPQRRRRDRALQPFTFSSGFEDINERFTTRGSLTVIPRRRHRVASDDGDSTSRASVTVIPRRKRRMVTSDDDIITIDDSD